MPCKTAPPRSTSTADCCSLPLIATFNLGGLAGTGNIVLTDADNNNVTISVGVNNATTTYSGVLSDNGSLPGGGLTKVGTGTLVLANVNTYSGPTTVNGGTLRINNANSLPNSPVTVNSANGLAFGAGVGTFNLISLAGSGSFALSDTGNNPVTLVVGSSNASTTYSGNLTDGGLGGALTKVGSGTLVLSGANVYAGNTQIEGGTLRLGPGASTLAGAVIMSNNTTFDITNSSQSIGSLADGSGTPAGTQVLLGSGTLTTGSDNTSSIFSGVISGSGGNLVQAGTGTFTLAGQNTYSGSTTVNNGSIVVTSGGGIWARRP